MQVLSSSVLDHGAPAVDGCGMKRRGLIKGPMPILEQCKKRTAVLDQMTAIYRVGERVDGLYDENTDEMWYPGRIRCFHLGESADAATFEVLYDDGEVEMNVRPEFLRQHVSGTICVGTRVLGRYDGGDEFYPGQISDVQENGKYAIAYDDGEVEEDVAVEYIMEPEEDNEEEQGADEAAENEEKVPSNTSDDLAPDRPEQQQEEDIEMEEPQDFPSNAQENEEIEVDEPAASEPERVFYSSKREPHHYVEPPQSARQNEDDSETPSTEVSAERTYIIDSLELLEKRLGDATSAKSVLSTLVKHMRAYPQVTADLVHERGGERLIIDALKFHPLHAVIQCYGFVLLRRLCFLCVKSTHYLLRNGIVELVIQAMNAFGEDAILQASACGALAVFTRVHAGLNSLIEFQVAQLVLSTLIYHKTYSVHTRQVHYYGCEVLLELCELDDLQTLNLLCGEHEEEFTGDMSPISLLLFLLRQGLSLDDKKACCAVGSLLMCLAASGKRAASSMLSLNGLAELSTVMARYPTEPSIQKYSAAASKQIALCSVRQSPTKRIKDTATEILREAESLENAPMDKRPTKRSVPRRLTGTGKRKSKSTSGYGASRGATYSSSLSYRNPPKNSKISSQYGQPAGGDMNSFSYPVRDYSAPQQPSSLVILDEGFGVDSGFGSTNKRKQSREDRQTELFEAYGVQGVPNGGRPYGTKRRQLRAHLASAESTWATPHQHLPSSIKPLSSRSNHLDHGAAYSHRDFVSGRQSRWEYDNEPQNSTYDPEVRQPRGAKRKKKNPGSRTAFQVKVESDSQLLVSREAHASYPSPQRLGAATKRAAKARQKRILATNHSSLTARSNNTSSESLNEYATQLFQDSTARGGTNYMTSSRLTPREKEEIRERERLSFAEKLHKMIDKAKSSLANGNTTTMPVDAVTRPQNSSAGSKTARKTREPSVKFSKDTRPKWKKASSTKQRTKDISTPREAIETRPAKPTLGVNKRPSSDVASVPVISRPKPVVSRAVVTPKVTFESKPRPVAKAAKAAPTKPADKPQDSVVETKPAEISPVIDTPEIDEPHQVEADVDAAEFVETPAPPVQQSAVPEETESTDQVDPVVSNRDGVAKVEADVVPSVVDEAQIGTYTAGTKDVEPRNAGDLPGNDEGIEKVIEVAPAEAETTSATVDVPLVTEDEAAPDIISDATVGNSNERSEDEQQSSEPLVENPSLASEPTEDQSSSAAVDAMYGDAFGEFDDNGGDDEEMAVEGAADTDDTQLPSTEVSDPQADVPLQDSKSGEALYDDGYDDFDEDDAPHKEETEAGEAPAQAEAGDNQAMEPLDTIASQPAEIAEEETPVAVAAAKEETTASAEQGGEGDNKSLHSVSVDERGDDVTDGDPGVSNVKGEQEPVDLNSDPVADPCEPEDDAHADPEDVAADEKAGIDTPSDHAGEGAPNGGHVGDVSEQAAEPSADIASSTSVVEPAETKGAVDAEPSAQPEDDSLIATPPNDPVVSIEPATDEATADPAQPQQDEEQSVDETNAQPEEPLSSDVTAPSLEESKKMSADNSAYDEDNFDDDEAHHVADPSEAVEVNPVAAPVEDTAKVTDQQQQEEDTPDNTEAVPEAVTPADAACSSERVEEESKTLAATSSELCSQSAVYEDEGFDDGEQEAPADNSEDKAIEQEPSGDEVAENATIDTPSESVAPVSDAPESSEVIKPEEVAEDETAPAAEPEVYEDGGFDNPERDDTAKDAAKSVIPDAVVEPSESQQPENSESTSTPELDVVSEPSLAGTETETPDAMAQEETQSAQEQVGDKTDEYNDDALEDNVDEVAPATENPVESSDPVPVSTESSAEPSAASEPPQSKADTEVAQEEAESPVTSAQPETYDDEEFDKGAEEEVAAPTAEESNLTPNDESKGKDLDIPASLEQPSGEAVDSADHTDEPVAVEGTLPESEPQTSSHPEQSSSEDSANSPDAVDDSVSEGKIEPEVATETPSEDVGDEAESPTENEVKVDPATDTMDNPVLEMAPSESEPQAATSDEQPNDQDNSTYPGDKPAVSSDPENTANIDQAENVPEPEAQSDTPIEPEDKPDQSADYTQGDDAFDDETPESKPAPVDAIVDAGTSAEPIVDAAQEETQYEDADFDDAEKDTASENKPDSDASEEATPVNSASPDYPPTTQAEETESVKDDSQVPTSDTTKEEAVDLPATTQVDEGAVETSQAALDPIADAAEEGEEQPTSDVVAAEAEVKDEPPVSCSDATAYEEDFPDDVPLEANENTAAPTEKEAVDNDGTPVSTESPVIDPNVAPDESVDDTAQPAGSADAAPDSPNGERYDDGFDDENTAPAIDASDSRNAVDISSAEASQDNIVAGIEQPRQDEAANVELDTKSAENTAQDEADLKPEQCEAADAAEAKPIQEPVESEQVTSEIEPARPGTAEATPVESETVESENIEPEAAIVDPEAVEPETTEPEVAQTEAIDIGTVPETREAETVNAEAAESGTVDPIHETQTTASATEELTTVEPQATEPEVVEPEVISTQSTEPEAVESVAVGSEVTIQESTEERSITEPVLEEPAAPEANQDEPTSITEPVVSDGEDLTASETAVEPSPDTPTESNHQSLTEEEGAAIETTEDAAQGEEASTVEGATDPNQSEDPVEDTTIPSVDAPAVEIPVEITLDEPQEPASPAEENASDAIVSADTVPQDDQEAITQSESTSEVVKEDTAEVRDEPVSYATSPAPAEPFAPSQEAQQDQEPDYTEADAPADEPPTIVPGESTPTAEVMKEESPKAPPEEPSEQEKEEISEATEELATEAEPAQPEDVSVESTHVTPPAASETEDQYDEDEGYNEFDDQDIESSAQTSPPIVEVPAPAATGAPATEDEYEEYENDDYGEEETAAETPRADPVATRIEPPVSAREQEIDEVVDAPADAEDAYADDQNEYNNENEEEDASEVPKSSPPKEDKPTTQAEASADEYEDDNEEECADDAIEDSSPPKPTPAAPGNKSDDEMEEELGYESDEGYAESDG
ncbi:hypothetical protein PI124_g7625 [Phytophthora idaei]|nr:hypothetical protein PI124_g7625 [Phytophthora idaei]